MGIRYTSVGVCAQAVVPWQETVSNSDMSRSLNPATLAHNLMKVVDIASVYESISEGLLLEVLLYDNM